MVAKSGVFKFGVSVFVLGAAMVSSNAFAQAPGAGKGEAAAAKPAEAPKADKNAAKKFYGTGKKSFEAGKYEDAIAAFKQADALVPGPAPRYFIAQAYDKLDKAAESVAAYKAYLELNPDEKKEAKKIAEAKERIAALEPKLPATLTVAVSPADAPGLQVLVDGKAATGPVSLPAGEHKVEASADGFEPHSESKTLKGNEKAEVSVTLKALPRPEPVAVLAPAPEPSTAPAPALPPPPPEPASQPSKLPAFVTLGIAGAGAALGTTFGILALGAQSDFDADPTEDNAQKAERNALISDMSFGVALTFGITGAVLLFSGGEEASESAAASARPIVAPFVGTTGGGLVANWRF